MKNKRYSNELKKKVVEEYLAGTGMMNIVRKYELSGVKCVQTWRDKYLEYGCFPDGRDKNKRGQPRKIDITHMTKDEYIKYLEIENDILNQLRSLSKNPQN